MYERRVYGFLTQSACGFGCSVCSVEATRTVVDATGKVYTGDIKIENNYKELKAGYNRILKILFKVNLGK